MIDERKLRDTFKFHVIKGRKVVHRGITNDLNRVQAAMQRTWPASEVRQIGRRTTRAQALRWERAGARRLYRTPHTEKTTNLITRLWRWAWAA